jgi:hypothetical protein
LLLLEQNGLTGNLLKLELMRYKHFNANEEDRQCTYNLTLWQVAPVALEGSSVGFVLLN